MFFKRFNKYIMLILLVICIILATVIFAPEPQVQNVVANKRVILPILISGGDASWKTCMEEVAREYMKENPNTEVVINATMEIDGIDYAKSLNIEDALGNFNGIVEMRNVGIYANDNKIIPLPKELTDLVNPVKTVNGKIYSIPRFYTCRGIMYNKTIFHELGLNIPKTYYQFLNVCEQLKNAGISPLVIGAGNLWHLDNWINGLFSNDVKVKYPNWVDKKNNNEVSWQDPEIEQVLEDFKVLFDAGYVDQYYQTTTDADTIEVLANGKAAMLYSGTWMFSQILKANPNFELGWFFLPNHEDAPIVDLNGNVEWAISSNCEEDREVYKSAVDFLKFYYSEDVYIRVLQNMNGISALKEELSYQTIEVQEEVIQAAGVRGKQEGVVLGQEGTPEGFANVLYKSLIELGEGKRTVRETQQLLDKEWDKRNENDQ